jgi:hypothetical protein
MIGLVDWLRSGDGERRHVRYESRIIADLQRACAPASGRRLVNRMGE